MLCDRIFAIIRHAERKKRLFQCHGQFVLSYIYIIMMMLYMYECMCANAQKKITFTQSMQWFSAFISKYLFKYCLSRYFSRFAHRILLRTCSFRFEFLIYDFFLPFDVYIRTCSYDRQIGVCIRQKGHFNAMRIKSLVQGFLFIFRCISCQKKNRMHII